MFADSRPSICSPAEPIIRLSLSFFLLFRSLAPLLRLIETVIASLKMPDATMLAGQRPFAPLPTQPSFVTLSPEEKAAGKWSRANMQRAIEILHRDGLLAISGAVDLEHVKALRELMTATSKEIKGTLKHLSQYNHGIDTNFLMSAPLTDPELRFEDVFSNEFVIAILENYLGPGLKLNLLTANCALANTTKRQNVHKDAPWLHPNCPYLVNTNLALSDFTPENGSTEFWLGSHVCTTGHEQVWLSRDAETPICDVAPDAVEARRKVRPGAQITVPMGTITLRDMRTWHAGMPNSTSEDRIMTAVGYAASWYPEPESRMKAPLSARELLTERTDHQLEFIPDDEWLAISQDWDLASETSIKLPDVVGHRKSSKVPAGEREWAPLNQVADGENASRGRRDSEPPLSPAKVKPLRFSSSSFPAELLAVLSLASLPLLCFPHSRKMPNVDMLTRPQSTLPIQPGLITLSPQEKAVGKWSRANMQRAMELMHRDGVLAVAGVVDVDHVKALREAMDPVARKLAASKTRLSQFNQGFATNFLMSPLLTNKDLLFDDVYTNRFVHSLIEAYLGPDIKIHLLTANVAMPHTQDRQRVHKDLPWIHPLAPFIVNLNLLLCDFNEHTGSTEFWCGSHNTTAWDQVFPSKDASAPICDVADDCLEARRLERPGSQVDLPMGTVLLRDLRTWHAGMPNHSDEWRIMTAVEYAASWYPEPARKQKAPLSAKPILEKYTKTDLDFVPDGEWESFAQNWDFADPKAMKLPSVPGADEGTAEGGEWVTLNAIAEEEKYVRKA
ncbi:hypothetical protein RTG_00834 [Rhodotorula toruloides ATCC 204091]|uniref:Phytanoyl-CoA dioxygenase family protein n=1 Tax=Rhodotorula toruloides TaxID=5286 RepID=A0A2T0AA70_RHOTO|nr:hypothetical protein RTG_00834 [Rhodotorula toruloides ATCC 204091]PRQ74910.1 hypothetical protein AAT19DRAFT_13932 [Rhodotorula toruloides]